MTENMQYKHVAKRKKQKKKKRAGGGSKFVFIALITNIISQHRAL
jgi:hypothetical protein